MEGKVSRFSGNESGPILRVTSYIWCPCLVSKWVCAFCLTAPPLSAHPYSPSSNDSLMAFNSAHSPPPLNFLPKKKVSQFSPWLLCSKIQSEKRRHGVGEADEEEAISCLRCWPQVPRKEREREKEDVHSVWGMIVTWQLTPGLWKTFRSFNRKLLTFIVQLLAALGKRHGANTSAKMLLASASLDYAQCDGNWFQVTI